MELQSRSRLSKPKLVALVGVLLTAVLVAYIWRDQWLVNDSEQRVAISSSEDTAETVAEDLPLSSIALQSPVRLKIDKIGVDAPIVPVGTEPDGAMAAPGTATDIGWYERSAQLGSSRRAMLLSGHYGLNAPEVLRRLDELKKGDKITIEGAKGESATYRVTETERQHRNEVDMEKAFNYVKGEESVSIITCIGEYDHTAKTYEDRHIVYALRVK